MRWVACTLAVLTGVALSAPGASARRAASRARRAPSGPTDLKELTPQPKRGDIVARPRAAVVPGVLPPARRRARARAEIATLSLETDPCDLVAAPFDRDRFLWPASPRLRTGAWVSVFAFTGPSYRFRKYDPEIVYDKQDTYVVGEVGAALRLGRVELSTSVPFIGLASADFYQKGVVDRAVRKTDRVEMWFTTKLQFAIRRPGSVWLFTPYVTLGLPTGARELYSVNLGGRTVEHLTGGPKALSVLPGLAVGWRRGILTAVVSMGPLARINTKHSLTPVEDQGNTTVSWMGAYQFGVTPFRDMVITLALHHLHQLTDRALPADGPEDLLYLVPGLRLNPYRGLFGHLGLSIPLTSFTRDHSPVMVLLQAGWEFR